MIRVAMLSFWHVHAWDYARQALNNPDTEIVAVWDEIAERGRTQAEKLGVPLYDRIDTLLAKPDIDAVIVATPTSLHRDVMVAAAQAGKHIFTEKVLAPTVHECNEIIAAVDQSGVKLTVSLPRLNAGYTLAIQDLLERKMVGDVTLVRTRLSHNGAIGSLDNPQGWLPEHFFNLEQSAGGAMIDLGCHPMYLASLFLGMPESVSAYYGYITGRDVEDNAVAVLNYPQGAVGIVEAGFVNRCSPFTIEVHGTEGSLLYGTPEEKLRICSSLMQNEAAGQWHVLNVPSDRSSAFEQWITHIQRGTTATENIQTALHLTMLMQAANLSAQQHQPVRLDTLPL